MGGWGGGGATREDKGFTPLGVPFLKGGGGGRQIEKPDHLKSSVNYISPSLGSTHSTG